MLYHLLQVATDQNVALHLFLVCVRALICVNREQVTYYSLFGLPLLKKVLLLLVEYCLSCPQCDLVEPLGTLFLRWTQNVSKNL